MLIFLPQYEHCPFLGVSLSMATLIPPHSSGLAFLLRESDCSWLLLIRRFLEELGTWSDDTDVQVVVVGDGERIRLRFMRPGDGKYSLPVSSSVSPCMSRSANLEQEEEERRPRRRFDGASGGECEYSMRPFFSAWARTTLASAKICGLSIFKLSK